MQSLDGATIDANFKRFILCSLKAPALHLYLKALWRMIKGKKFRQSTDTCNNMDEP